MHRLPAATVGTIEPMVTSVTSLPSTAHQRFAETDEIGRVGNVLLHGEERAALDEEGRIVAHDAGEQQAFGIGRRARHDHLQPRYMREPGVQALGVLRPLAPALADDGPDRHRHFGPPAGHEAPRRHPVDDLVDRIEHEIEPLVDDHGAQPGIACACGQRGESRLRRSVCRTRAGRRNVRLGPLSCRRSRLGVGADPVDEDVGIELHRLPQRGIDRLRETQRRAARRVSCCGLRSGASMSERSRVSASD